MMKKVILITGSSRGIGAATALLAAKQGYAVCVNYFKHPVEAKTLVDEITKCGGKAIAVMADISSESHVLSLFEQIYKTLGPITALVNNAGILEKQTSVEKIDVERLERIFRVNVIGSFLCAREAVKRMSTQRGGQGGNIVNVSSRASCLGSPNEYVDYAASKGAIDTLTIGLASEVAPQGIRVNAVRPGFIFTDMHTDGGEAGRVERLAPHLPMQRGGHPEEVANAILWLLSEEASYVTGTFIDVAGGR
jgi:NAD(P)-dependent dehydrogenase (short-subunit alcohol dehydrogenase family)